MKYNAKSQGIYIKEAPRETPTSIGTGERYHAPLRVAYNRIWPDLDRRKTDGNCLGMAVFSVKSNMGTEGLCTTLLVFGTIPRPARKIPSATKFERASAIENAMTDEESEKSRRRIAFGLRLKGGPKVVERSQQLIELPAGSSVLV